MGTMANRPYWQLHFDADGHLQGTDANAVTDDIASSGVIELVVFSHGWGTSEQHADDLYASMFPLIADAAAQAPSLGQIGFVGVYWPSLWFPDEPAAKAPEVAAAMAAGRPGAADVAYTGAALAQAMSQGQTSDAQRAAVTEMGALIDAGVEGVGSTPQSDQQQNIERFHTLLGQVVAGESTTTEDSGESAVWQGDPRTVYQDLSDAMKSTPPAGDEQGLDDIFGKIWNGAKDAVRVASYWQMKNRAGGVGNHGLGPLLETLHGKNDAVRVHLIGHSFGARLVAYALKAFTGAATSPVCSLTLVQGAFSHWCFAGLAGMPFDTPGGLDTFSDRVHGPLVSTFSQFDWAVGVWYPKASALAGDATEAIGPPKWGGMGSDGFQGVGPAADLAIASSGEGYVLDAGTYHRVDAQAVIKDISQSSFAGAHSDIAHPEVAWLIVSAAAAPASD